MAAVHFGPVPSSAMHPAESPGQMYASAPPFLPADHWAVSSTVSRFPGPRIDCMEPEMRRQMQAHSLLRRFQTRGSLHQRCVKDIPAQQVAQIVFEVHGGLGKQCGYRYAKNQHAELEWCIRSFIGEDGHDQHIERKVEQIERE